MTNLFERSLDARDKAAVACAAGCAFCCYQPVAVNGPEALALAARARLNPEYEDNVLAAAASLLAGQVNNMRCPLLAPTNDCSAYAGRPLACHAYVSISVQDCKSKFEAPGSAVVKEPISYDAVRQHCRLILAAAIQAAGLPSTRYDLRAAVAVALQTDNGEKRWLRGENIFAQVAPISPFAPADQRIIDAMAYNIAPTL
jgi:Fe-S-cluster containining protein